MKTYYVYAIGTHEILVPPYRCCYVGVTNNLRSRWKYHEKSPYTVGVFIREYGLVFEQNMIVLFEGTPRECFLMEEQFRPFPFIGLNEAAGGRGGYTTYETTRNKKISEKVREARKRKKWSSHKNRDFVGRNNPNAKQWVLYDPSGKEYHICGGLSGFCVKHKLLESCLRYNIGETILPPGIGCYGGYRAKNKQSLLLRTNTIGWRLVEMAKTEKVS